MATFLASMTRESVISTANSGLALTDVGTQLRGGCFVTRVRYPQLSENRDAPLSGPSRLCNSAAMRDCGMAVGRCHKLISLSGCQIHKILCTPSPTRQTGPAPNRHRLSKGPN